METLFLVREAGNGTPIPGAAVYIPGTSVGKTTDASGLVSLEVPAGSTVTVDAVGYQATSQNISGNTTAITVDLALDGSLPQATVTARRPRKLLILALAAVIIYLIWKL